MTKAPRRTFFLTGTLDRSGEVWPVFRRSPRACRGLFALPEPHRGRPAPGYDPAGLDEPLFKADCRTGSDITSASDNARGIASFSVPSTWQRRPLNFPPERIRPFTISGEWPHCGFPLLKLWRIRAKATLDSIKCISFLKMFRIWITTFAGPDIRHTRGAPEYRRRTASFLVGFTASCIRHATTSCTVIP